MLERSGHFAAVTWRPRLPNLFEMKLYLGIVLTPQPRLLVCLSAPHYISIPFCGTELAKSLRRTRSGRPHLMGGRCITNASCVLATFSPV